VRGGRASRGSSPGPRRWVCQDACRHSGLLCLCSADRGKRVVRSSGKPSRVARAVLGVSVWVAGLGALVLVTLAALGGGSASAGALNLTGTWQAEFYCTSGPCPTQNPTPDTYTLTQAQGSSTVSGTDEYGTAVTGTLSGSMLTASQDNQTFNGTISADGDSWSGTFADANLGISGTDTATREGGSTTSSPTTTSSTTSTSTSSTTSASSTASTTTTSTSTPCAGANTSASVDLNSPMRPLSVFADPFASGVVRAASAVTIISVGGGKSARQGAFLSRDAADRRALALLKPARSPLADGVAVYGLALKAGTLISEATLGYSTALKATIRLREPAWLYWEDLDPSARFFHPSRVLVLSARGGRVLASASFVTFPDVNGQAAAFVATSDSRLRVYSRPPEAKRPRVVSAAQIALLKRVAAVVRTVLTAHPVAGKSDVSHSTLITLVSNSHGDGDTFANEQAAVTNEFALHGVSTQAVAPSATTRADLSDAVTAAVAAGNTNITFFIDGHGVPANTSDDPTVLMGNGVTNITASDLTAIVEAHPEVTFNVIVDACYSGRFVDPLSGFANVNSVTTSTSASEPGQSPEFLIDTTNQAEAEVKTPDGTMYTGISSGALNGIDPFAQGLTYALIEAFSLQGTDVDINTLLQTARSLEPTYDLAAALGQTTPSPKPRTGSCPRPPSNPPTPASGWNQ
jgi:hypothetical protein